MVHWVVSKAVPWEVPPVGFWERVLVVQEEDQVVDVEVSRAVLEGSRAVPGSYRHPGVVVDLVVVVVAAVSVDYHREAAP